MLQAAERLGVSPSVVRRLISGRILRATQILPGAPWEIDSKAVASPEVIHAAAALKNRDNHHVQDSVGEGTPRLPGLDEESVNGKDLP
jgi:hypothetical protein